VTGTLVYARYELLRTFRNRRLYILSIAFPLVLYYAIAAPNRHEHSLGGTGISAPVYFMVGLVAFGTMNAVLGSGARIAAERSVGWNRQLRLTPLSSRSYFRVKVLTAYVMAAVTIALLYIAGGTLGVRLAAGDWVAMTCLILVGLAPFAALGILIGHLVTSDTVGPAIGGTTALLALLGGVWFPITSGAMHVIAEGLPSFWLVQASRVGIGGHVWGTTGWLVVVVWTVVAAALARRAYARDTRRV
jgi:ABC-2 type transport system permease protein